MNTQIKRCNCAECRTVSYSPGANYDDEGFSLIITIAARAKRGYSYSHLLDRLKDVSAKSGKVQAFVKTTIVNIERKGD